MASEWLDDAFGPDGVRVTICVEPAVERIVREGRAWGVFGPRPFESGWRRELRKLWPAVVQETVLDDRWAVVVEADSGQRLRLTRASRDEALAAARAGWQAVQERGVAALEGLT